MNPAVRFHLDATPALVRFPIVTQANLRDAWAVLSYAGTQWFFYSLLTNRWLRLPVTDLDGKTPAEIVEDALDRLHLLPAIHPAARSAQSFPFGGQIMNTVHETPTCSQNFVVGNHDDPDQPPHMQIVVAPANAIREIAERSYAAGCGIPEFHKVDCQEETDAILLDVLSKVKPEPEMLTSDEFWDREEYFDRLRALIAAKVRSMPGHTGSVEITNWAIRVDLGGPDMLRIPVRALEGIDPRMVPAIVESFVEAYKAGGRRAS
ncbi:hypothetical protein NS365_05440 [Aureimonas ureilytica]|uniref:Uncharacterized protein n=1 Tax=Aureimonas ureilytica TaxID=401562 RepID=A0A175RU82_9HYPH|nr:hypothetical protein [Aureimonas ureilytica]KTR06878.1 hypothetical protein NS365_05440 [Aureimonas ureilytica]